jgi:hypothetical protein
MLLILTIVLALFEQQRRDCALELILGGDEATPIASHSESDDSLALGTQSPKGGFHANTN